PSHSARSSASTVERVVLVASIATVLSSAFEASIASWTDWIVARYWFALIIFDIAFLWPIVASAEGPREGPVRRSLSGRLPQTSGAQRLAHGGGIAQAAELVGPDAA